LNIIAIIPARMGSSRFPGKPMAKISGIPMIGHVYSRVNLCKVLTDVFVATCDQEIYDYIISINGKAIMTAATHERASDRSAEAMYKIEEINGERIDILVMVQGDEPMISPIMIDNAVQPLVDDPSIGVSNLMALMTSNDEADPNEVKVVVDANGFALYFSREAIPSNKKFDKKIEYYKQVCVIPFKRDSLIKFSQLEPTPLEIIESVDMNRLVENGIKVKMIQTNLDTYAVDTPEDLLKVNRLMKRDALIKKYI